MSSQAGSIIDTIREPAYTGDNRCIPCTVVNVAIAAVAAALVAVISPEVAVALFVLTLGLIYLRGYLVPGTPELTKRYLPDRIHRRFDHHPAAEASTEGEVPEFETVKRVKYYQEHKVDMEEYLVEAGIIEYDYEFADVRLSIDFVDRVDTIVADLDVEDITPAQIAELFDEEPKNVTDEGRDYPAYKVGFQVRKWPSVAAFLTDLAGETVVREFADDWAAVPLRQRNKMRETLRSLREYCTVCGGDIVLTDDEVESCCGKWLVTAVKCGDCDQHYVELDPQQVEESDLHHGLTPD